MGTWIGIWRDRGCWCRAHELSASDPDYATRDLYNAIAEGRHPSWSMKIQVMTFEQAEAFRWNPFDLTKVGLFLATNRNSPSICFLGSCCSLPFAERYWSFTGFSDLCYSVLPILYPFFLAGVAAERVPVDSGRPARAGPQPARLLRRGGADRI